MRISPFDLLAPHYCCSCGAVGQIICDNCKKHIVSRSFRSCLVCAKTIRNSNGLCCSCKQKVPFKRIWCVGERCDALKSLIDAYKFERASGAYREIVDLLDEYLPKLPSNTVVVPVPTISTHIRQRGYDHAAKLARELAKRRELPYSTVLRRETSTVQHTASQGERWQKHLFVIKSSSIVVLLSMIFIRLALRCIMLLKLCWTLVLRMCRWRL